MEFFFVPKSIFCENGNLDSLNSKSFVRILDHKLCQFVEIIDRRSRSLDSIAYFEAMFQIPIFRFRSNSQ